MTKEEKFELFGEFDPAKYETEVKETWGDTDAYKESTRRSKRYRKADWQRIKDEGVVWMNEAIALFDQGIMPEDAAAMDLVEAARLAIDRDFYPCSHEMHVSLGEMYIADERFAAYYDTRTTGLAKWFNKAIMANAARTCS